MPLPFRQLRAIFAQAGKRGSHVVRRVGRRALSKDYFNRLNASARIKDVKYSERLKDLAGDLAQVKKMGSGYQTGFFHGRYKEGHSVRSIYDNRIKDIQSALSVAKSKKPRVIKAFKGAQYTNVHGLKAFGAHNVRQAIRDVPPGVKFGLAGGAIYGALVTAAVDKHNKRMARYKVRRTKKR